MTDLAHALDHAIAALDEVRRAAFDESLHPRDERGRFGEKGGGIPERWGDDASEGRPRQLDQSGHRESRERYSTEGMVRARLQAAFPNAKIDGEFNGWQDHVGEEQEWLDHEGGLDGTTDPFYQEELAVIHSTADRIVGLYDGLEQIAGQFPEVAARVTSLEMHGPLLESGGDAETIVGPDKVEMNFSMASLIGTDSSSNFSTSGQAANDEGDMRRWSFGVALHEFGHVIDSYAATVEHGAEFTSDDYMAYKFRQSNAPVMLSAWEDEFPDAFATAGDVSTYAMTEPAEYTAEVFALSRLDPYALPDDARNVVEWLEQRAAMSVGDRVPVMASTAGHTAGDGAPGIVIVDMLKGDCVPVQYALGITGNPPVTAAIAGPAEIIREIPDKFVTDDEDERVRRAYVFDEAEHPRDTSGRFATKDEIAQAVDALPTQTTVTLFDGRQIPYMDADGLASAVKPPDPFPYDESFKKLTDSEDPADLDKAAQMFDANRAVERVWKDAMRDEISTGQISLDDANARWGDKYESSSYRGMTWANEVGRDLGGDGWQPLPQELWHVTTNASGVEARGMLLTRDELGMGHAQGLGGGSSETISFTANRETAEEIYNAMHEASRVANGSISVQNMIDSATAGEKAQRPFVEDFMRYYAQYSSPREREQFTGPDGTWRTGDPYPRMVQEAINESTPGERLDIYKVFSLDRQLAGGPEDPLFFGTDADALAQKTPEDFGIVKVAPVPGAMGVQLSAMGEWRVPTGAAVTIEKIANTASLVWQPQFTRRAYVFDESAHPRDTGGRFTFADGGDVSVGDPALDRWVTGGAGGDMSAAARLIVLGGMSEAAWMNREGNTPRARETYEAARELMDRIPDAPHEPEMFRGILNLGKQVGGAPRDEFPLEVGGTYREPLASWTTNRALADTFQTGEASGGASKRPEAAVTVTVHDAPGIPAPQVDPSERVSGGTYTVTKVTPTGTTDVESKYHESFAGTQPGDPRLPDVARDGRTFYTGVPTYDVEVAWQPTQQAALSRFARRAYVFDEEAHPRGEHGRFTDKGGDGNDASAADYGLHFDASYVNDPDVLAAKQWDGWDQVPVTQVDPRTLVAVEDSLSRRSIDKVVSGREPLREGYVARVVRKDDGTEIIVDGHHRAAMASAMNRPLDVKIADAAEIRGTRQAYTAENFDESLVRREHGRFATKEQTAAEKEAEKISAVMDRRERWHAALDRISAALPGVDVKVDSSLAQSVVAMEDKPPAEGKYAGQGSVVDAIEGTATGFERLGAKYPEVAARLGTVTLGKTNDYNALGQYEHHGSDRTIGVGDGAINMPEITINLTRLTGEANRNRFVDQPEIYTIPVERAPTDVARLADGAVTHEFGHLLDYVTPGGSSYVGHGDAVAFSNASDGHVSQYATTSQREYFAEVFSANELGFRDRLTQEDLDVLDSATPYGGRSPALAAALADGLADPPPDTFEGSIIWEYAAVPRTASSSRFARRAYTFDEAAHPRGEHGRFTIKDETPASDYDAEFEAKYGYPPPEGEGDCFPTAYHVATALENEGKDDVRVVNGVVTGQGEVEGVKFPHAWVEYTDKIGEHSLAMVVDRSNGNDVTVPRALYYKIGQIDEADVKRYSTDEARINMVKSGHWGPWE